MLPCRADSPVRFRETSRPRLGTPALARAAPFLALVLVGILLLTAFDPSSRISRQSRSSTYANSLRADAPVSGCRDTRLTALEGRENAAIVLLVREADLHALLPTLRNFEERFNARFRYPYVFIASPDEGDLSRDFRTEVAKVLPAGAETEWGVVPEQHWEIPTWLDKDDVRQGFVEQEKAGVQYAGREGYHHMCRWYSGLFARHPLLAKYDWYWRLEPGVRFYCSITYDPFRFLSLHRKVYGFVITVVENLNTIPTLFSRVREYLDERGIRPPDAALWGFLTRRNKLAKEEFTGCHFWTNFEIGDLRFFRSPAYQEFFRALDDAGGFYHERWGDAPVRSLALGALAGMEQVHYFEDFAYQHDWFFHCPARSTRSLGPPEWGHTGQEVAGCDCQCPKAGELQGRDKGQELVDMDDDWRYSCLPMWKEAMRRSRG